MNFFRISVVSSPRSRALSCGVAPAQRPLLRAGRVGCPSVAASRPQRALQGLRRSARPPFSFSCRPHLPFFPFFSSARRANYRLALGIELTPRGIPPRQRLLYALARFGGRGGSAWEGWGGVTVSEGLPSGRAAGDALYCGCPGCLPATAVATTAAPPGRRDWGCVPKNAVGAGA